MVCTHLDNLRKTIPAANFCGGCLKTGDLWIRPYMCASIAKSSASRDERNPR